MYRIVRKLYAALQKYKFNKCGDNVWFDPISSQFSYKTITLGKNVFIGPRAWFSSSHSNIIIGDNVMFGPSDHIFGGNHKYDLVGKLMNEVEKSSDHRDKNVIIKNEVWVGGGVILLTGVTIGRGAIIGAGSVVTKDIMTYSVNAGNPCTLIKMRFTPEEIHEHEKIIGYNGVV